MYVPISKEDILSSDTFGFFLGIPHEKVACTGTIDGTNKEFTVPDAPIYPAAGVGVIPAVGDVTAYLRKTTVDTVATISSIKTIVDSLTGDSIDGAIELTTAPAAPDADGVYASYYEELEPFFTQDISPTVKQDTKDVGRIRSTDVVTSYGKIDIQLKAEQVLSKDALKYMKKLFWGTYTGSKTPVTGYTPYSLNKKPIDLKAYMTIDWEGDNLGRIYLDSCRISPDLPSIKQGDNGGLTLDMTISEMPVLVLPTD